MSAAASISWKKEQTLLDLFRQTEQQGGKLRIEGLGHRLLIPNSESGAEKYSLASWDSLLSYHPADLVVSVEAGMRVKTLNAILREHDQWIPLTVADGQDDTLGGALSAGVDGIWRGGYGPLRDRVLGLVVVSPGFGVIRAGAGVVKNVAGYNLPRLFLGSRGNLGVITQITLKVSPILPEQRSWMWTDSPANLTAKARQLISQARPWAAIMLVREPNPGEERYKLWAAWHGMAMDHVVSAATKEEAQEEKNPPVLPQPQDPSSWATLKGAVPLTRIEDLVATWKDGEFAVECQSGDFFGFVPRSSVKSLVEWIRFNGGGVRVLQGSRLDQPPKLPDYWARLKTAYDPMGILEGG